MINKHVKGKSKFVCVSVLSTSYQWLQLRKVLSVGWSGCRGSLEIQSGSPATWSNLKHYSVHTNTIGKVLCTDTNSLHMQSTLSTMFIFLSSCTFSNIKVILWDLYPISMSPVEVRSTTGTTEDSWSLPSSSSLSLFNEP